MKQIARRIQNKVTKSGNGKGQALLEFALIAVVFLLMVFLVIESARIFWGWITVQNAAREGARYAITGGFEPTCATTGIPKYSGLCGPLDMRRPTSVIGAAHDIMSGLPLNEDPNSQFEDDNWYNIEIWGVDSDGLLRGSGLPTPQGPEPFAGVPEQPVVVRVTYRVPIITPFFSGILPSIPVMGQTTLNNEQFGQLGGTARTAGVPPPIPQLPTPGPTPSQTPTPTPGITPSATPTSTPSPTATDAPCDIRFTTGLAAGSTFASVTGLWNNGGTNHQATFYDVTAGDDPVTDPGGTFVVLATINMQEDPDGDAACPGVGDTFANPLSPPLTGNNWIRVISTDGSTDLQQVQPGTSTPTATYTPTASNTPTATSTATVTPTETPPSTPYVRVLPTCASGSSVQLNVSGGNWPTDEDVNVYITVPGGSLSIRYTLNATHSGFFTTTFSQDINNNDGTYTITAISSSATDSDTFIVPCPFVSPTPVTATPTGTPIPPDLIISGPPLLLNTPPIQEYEPVQFQVAITNTGELAVNNLFFVDLYFDPVGAPFTDTIPLQYSSGYIGVGSLGAGQSRQITITSEIGFTGGFSERTVYAMVDSLEGINETNELNNISEPPLDLNVTPAPATPTPTGTPDGSSAIAGVTYAFTELWASQNRTLVWLRNLSDPLDIIGPVTSDDDGIYIFNNVPSGVDYQVIACLPVAGADYVGVRPLVTSPNLGANVYMLSDPAGCPLP